MKPKLSIIIPCYNCVSTLRAAVDSCYIQNLPEHEFEIIMVDDGSADTTRTLMETLKREHSNITLLFHPENRGGGAARNTGIKASIGSLIYCLDSDNFFAPQSVAGMIAYLETTAVAGVAFFDRRYFYGNNHTRYQSHINHIQDRPVTLDDLFTLPEHILLDNFFYTRAAYEKSAGYPEHHGFDTQGFELRFLATGNTVMVCPNSLFYHRQDTRQNSYFQRVYKQGHFSRNMYLVYEDVIHCFTKAALRLIMEFDIFTYSKLDTNNLKALLDLELQRTGRLFTTPKKNTSLTEARQQFMGATAVSKEPTDLFARAVIEYKMGNYKTAISAYTTLLGMGIDSPVLYFNLLRCGVGLTKKYPIATIEDQTEKNIRSLIPATQSLSSLSRFAAKPRAILKRIIG
jgi:glycosyltransferase involved in cell wall biosynthesis